VSLRKEAFAEVARTHKKLQNRVCELSKSFNPPFDNLDDKVQMNHYGSCYLFGKRITEATTDAEIAKIIEQTPEEEYDGAIDFFGEWRLWGCKSVNDKQERLQDRVNALFRELNIGLEGGVMKDANGKLYLFGKLIDIDMTDDELAKIIKDTPKEHYFGRINILTGEWII
jgi:hypothetical protein